MLGYLGHNFKALSCTPTYLNALISPFLHINSYEIWRCYLLDANLLIIDADKNV